MPLGKEEGRITETPKNELPLKLRAVHVRVLSARLYVYNVLGTACSKGVLSAGLVLSNN